MWRVHDYRLLPLHSQSSRRSSGDRPGLLWLRLLRDPLSHARRYSHGAGGMIRIALSQSTRANGLALGCAASLAELGPIVALLRDGQGLAAVLCAGLAYQAGGAAARFLPGVPRT